MEKVKDFFINALLNWIITAMLFLSLEAKRSLSLPSKGSDVRPRKNKLKTFERCQYFLLRFAS